MKYSQTEHLIDGLAEVAKSLTLENLTMQARLARYENLSKKASTYIKLISRPAMEPLAFDEETRAILIAANDKELASKLDTASMATPEPEACHPDESLENAYVSGQEVQPYEEDYLPRDFTVHGREL